MCPRPPRASAILRMIRSPWQRSRLRRRHPGNDLLHPAAPGLPPGPPQPWPSGTPHSTGQPTPTRPGPDAAQMWQWAREGGNSQQLLQRCTGVGERVSGMEGLGVSPGTAGTAGTRRQECPRGHTPVTRSCRGVQLAPTATPVSAGEGGHCATPSAGAQTWLSPSPLSVPPTITKGSPWHGHREAHGAPRWLPSASQSDPRVP